MDRWRRFQLSPTQQQLLQGWVRGYWLVGLGILSLVVLLWPAGSDLPVAALLLTLLLALAGGVALQRPWLQAAGRLDEQVAGLPRPASDPNSARDQANVLNQLQTHAAWLTTVASVLDEAAHADEKAAAAATARRQDFQPVRAQLRAAQADLAAHAAAGRATATELEALRQRLRDLDRALHQWQQNSGDQEPYRRSDQLARWRAGLGLALKPADSTARRPQLNLDAARRQLKSATRALSVKATLLFLWIFFVQTARSLEFTIATLVTIALSLLVLRFTEQMGTTLPLNAAIGHDEAQGLRLQRHWRRASLFLLDGFWFSVLLLTWADNAGAAWAAGLWLLTGAGLVAAEGWGAAQLMEWSVRPLPAGDQQAALQAARRQERTLRSASLTLIALTWICYEQELIAYPPQNGITWLVTLSLVWSLTYLIPPLAATWFGRRWQPRRNQSNRRPA